MPARELSRKLFWRLVFPAFLLAAIYPYRVDGYLNPYDEGLWLGAAHALESGKTLYKDAFFHYGWLLSAYLSLVVKWLPTTISSLRGSFWVLNAAGLLVIYACLLRWVKNPVLRLAYAMLLFSIPSSASVLTIPMAGRYAAGFLPLLAWPAENLRGYRSRLLSSLSGCFSVAACFISQEVGVASVMATAYFLCIGRGQEDRRRFCLAGMAVSALLFILLLSYQNNIWSYMSCAWMQTPMIVFKDHWPAASLSVPMGVPWYIAWQKYDDFLSFYVLVGSCVAAFLYVLVLRHRKVPNTSLLQAFVVFALVASISAWVRSDRWHIYFALSPSLFLWAVFSDRSISIRSTHVPVILLVIGLMLTMPHVKARQNADKIRSSLSRRTSIPRMGTARLPAVQAAGYEYVVGWIQSHTKSSESILFFPYDGNINYLADRQHPSYYSVLALATTSSMKERIVSDLSNKRPEWVIWDQENTGFDGVSIEVFLHPVGEYIKGNYEIRERAGPFLFMRRKDLA